MPPLIGAGIAAIAGSAGLGTLFAFGSVATTALAYGITAIATIGAQFALNKLAGKKKDKSDTQINAITIRQPLPVRTRGYGRNKMGGALFFEAAVPIVYQPLWLGIIHCEGPIDSIESTWLNDSNTGLPSGNLGGLNGALPWLGFIGLETKLGEEFQSPSGILSSHVAGWNGELRGLAYTVMQCSQPPLPTKNFQYFYPNGVPAVRVVARCCKIWDPRDGSQSLFAPSSWKWSRNPALIIMDYLTVVKQDTAGKNIPRGMGLPWSRINIDSFKAFANMCDQTYTSLYSYDSQGNVVAQPSNEQRYSCDGVYQMNEAPTEVLSRMMATCDATLYTLPDGTIGIRGGQWVAPTFTITDDMILSADLTSGSGKMEKFNHLKISFTSPVMDFQLVEGPPWEDEDDEDENGVLAEEFSLPWVQSYSQARRLAKIATAKNNPDWRYNSLVCSLAALAALGEEFVHVKHTMPGIDEDFLVTGFKIMPNMTVELQLSSISSDAYAWDYRTEDDVPPSLHGGSVAGSSGGPVPPNQNVDAGSGTTSPPSGGGGVGQGG